MPEATIILYGNAIFTATDKNGSPFAGGVAIQGDKIIAVGSKEEISQYQGPQTKIYHCGEDSLIMPGFNDGHQHLRMIIGTHHGVPLRYLTSEEACIASAVQWEKEHPEYQWVYGMGWQYTQWENQAPPNNKKLNEAFPNKPVCLLDVDAHAAWLNDCALKEVGITKEAPDPPNSVITRYPDGTPTGYVQEEIVVDISSYALSFMETDTNIMKRNLKALLQECNQFGLTGVSEMLTSKPEWLDIYEYMSAKRELTCQINITQDFWSDDYLEAAARLKQRFAQRDADISFYAIKCFLDGVGIGYTGWQLHPYHDRPDWYGEPIMPEEKLRKKILDAIASGQHVHLHACGDKSVRKALDWWEESLAAGKTKPGQRYAITHNDTVDPADIPRFTQLGVIASMQPDMLAPCLKWEDNLYPQRYGPELCKTAWPCRSFIDAGAILAFSTDSPVGLIDPMYNVYRSVTRLHADGKPAGGFIPEQKISLANALWAYTYGSAYQLGQEDFLGTLEVGKRADIAVLDKNLFAADPEAYMGTKAKLTLFRGNVVYEK